MLTILVLFVGLTLATAVIAYWSDNLGKKLGKKRVSLWGMRPRTTATFLTIASSWLIMIFTLGVMLTLFSPLRQALLRFDEVKAQESSLRKSKTQLTGQVSGLNEQLATLTGQTKSLKAQVKGASDKLAKVSEQLKKSGEAAERARSEQKSAEKEAAAARKSADNSKAREQAAIKREQNAKENLQTVTKQRDATQQQREAAQHDLKAAQAELKSASAEVKSAAARVKTAGERVKTAQGKAKLAEEQFKQAQANLAKVQQDLAAAQKNEDAAVTNAKTARASAEASRIGAEKSAKLARDANQKRKEADKQYFKALEASLQAQSKVAQAQRTVEELEKQGEELRNANQFAVRANRNIASQADFILASDIRVPVGRTLMSRTFDQGLSFTEATEGLRTLFERAAQEIAPEFLPSARLKLAERQEPVPKVNDSDPDVFVVLQDDDIYNGLATTISLSQTPLSVRLISDRNHLEGEKTLNVRFIIVPVRPAMPSEAELANATFDQNRTDAQLFSALLKLVEAGRQVAAQNGVTPPLSPAAKEFYAPGTNEQIFVALRKISALDGRARVRIVTDKAISTTDQLSVRFDVQPLDSTTAATPRKAPA